MNRAELKTRAKQSLANNWGSAIIGMIIHSIVLSLLATTGVGTLVTGLVSIGYLALFIALLRGNKPSFESCFSAITNNIVTKFISTLLVLIYTFLWTLLFIIPGIVKSYSYAMTPYILMDRPELSATEAIKESEKMMKGHKMELFVLDLSFIGWFLLCIPTFGLLILYVEPYYLATHSAFYLELKGPDAQLAAEEEQPIYTPEA